MAPEFYVFPVDVIQAAPRSIDWGKVNMKGISGLESYREGWELVSDFLDK
ncbi:hypothetical protein GCM10007159_39900 [Modicisalibacter luteus]|nr:hypothetical protein GCM10007159_39900 [Halomonas lutea]